MRVASWNVNGLRARLEFVLQWLREREPDVVGLQELKLTEAQFPRAEFEAAGYHALVHGQKSWNGVAILSREPGELLQLGLPGQQEQGARLIEARVAGLRFVSAYCPNGKSLGHADYPRKLEWFDSLADWVVAARLTDGPSLLCGDFNICPSPLDSWDEVGLGGEIFHTDAERSRMQRLYDLGLVDLFRSLHPDQQAFSWWDYRGGAFHRKQGLRIDFLLGTPSLVERLRSVEIDREWRKKQAGLTASDHAPVFADLD